MNDEKTAQIYMSIKAPAELRERVMETASQGAPAASSKKAVLRAILPLAACFALVIGLAVFSVGNFGKLSVSVSGVKVGGEPVAAEVPAMARLIEAEDTSIILNVETGAETVVSVSEGSIRLSGSESGGESITVGSDCEIVWSLSSARAESAVITFSNKNGDTSFCLEKDAATGVISIKQL